MSIKESIKLYFKYQDRLVYCPQCKQIIRLDSCYSGTDRDNLYCRRCGDTVIEPKK